MAKNVQLTVDIKGGDSVGKAAEKTKTLKQELRELKNELASGNLTGKAFDEATQRAAKLSDTIIDVNNRVKALATDGPDVVLKGFGDMATGIVGGFTAAQGAMALFGSENEDLQKQLVKLQGATALLNGLQQVNATLQGDSAAMVALNTAKTKIATFVQARYTAAVGTSTGAMKAMRIVGMTLGIGVIVAAVGLLIANFDKVKAVVMNVVDRFKNLGSGVKNILSVMFPFIGVIRLVYAGLEKMGVFAETAADRYEKLEKATQTNMKQMQREIDLMEAQGVGARELYLAKHKLLMVEYQLMEAKRTSIGLTKEEQEAQKDLANSINILNAEETKRIKDDAEKKQQERDKANQEAAKKRKEEREREKKEYEENKKEALKRADKDIKDQLKKFEDDKQKLKEARLEAEFEEEDARDKRLQKEQEDERSHAENIIAIDRGIQDAKIEAVQTGAQILGQLAGQNKTLQLSALAIEKGAAIAGVIINASRELSANALSASLNPLNAATGGAAGAAQLAKSNALTKIRAGISIASISAAGLQGAKQISSAGGSGGGGSVQPPNIRGSQTSNEQPTPQPTKVFVTETDIRSVTRKVDGIFSQATII
jgi:hypothetical protein